MKRLLLVVTILAVGLGGALVWWKSQSAPDEDVAISSGVLEGTELDLGSRVGGRVLEVLVAEGEAVEPDQLLARLDCRGLATRRDELEAQLARTRAEGRAAAAQIDGVAAQRAGSSSRVRSASERAAAIAARRERAAREAARVERLGTHATESQRDQASTQVTGLEHELSAARREAASLRAQVRQAGAEQSAAEARAEAYEHAVAGLEANLRRVALDLEECVVRAPRAGVVETVFLEPGELLAPGHPLLRLIDLDALEVTLFVTNADLAEVSPGMRAEVVADAYPESPVTGTVRTVAVAASFTPRNIQTRPDRARLVYPVAIDLPNPEHRLLPGMPVEVRLAHEARR